MQIETLRERRVPRFARFSHFCTQDDPDSLCFGLYRLCRVTSETQASRESCLRLKTATTLREQLHALGKAVAQAARENRHSIVYWAAYMRTCSMHRRTESFRDVPMFKAVAGVKARRRDWWLSYLQQISRRCDAP